MKRHPSQSVLRQILDEPGAVPELDRTHAASCVSCRRHSEAMAADAAVAAAALTGANEAVDPLPALRRLRKPETGVVPPRPTVADRLHCWSLDDQHGDFLLAQQRAGLVASAELATSNRARRLVTLEQAHRCVLGGAGHAP